MIVLTLNINTLKVKTERRESGEGGIVIEITFNEGGGKFEFKFTTTKIPR
jgi:hypothetical protein